MNPTLFSDEESARKHLEKLRWKHGVYCPHCGCIGAYKLEPKPDSKRPGRKGLYKCKEGTCRKQFTVTVGSIFEDSHIPLHKWLNAMHLMCASKKGMSAHQLHRMMDVTYRSAWFMAHRIRHAMTHPIFIEKLKGVVEADETYFGGKSGRRDMKHNTVKVPVFSLVERQGVARSFKIDRVTAANLKQKLGENVDSDAHIMTDSHPGYKGVKRRFASHEMVNHAAGEYVRGAAHTNTVEGFFSILKRGVYGVYHHISPDHLQRYLAEFDFRYSNRKVTDELRAETALKAAEGKRLTYKDLRRHIVEEQKRAAIFQRLGQASRTLKDTLGPG